MKNIFKVRVLVITALLSLPLLVSAADCSPAGVTGGAASVTQGFMTLGCAVDTLTKYVVSALATLFATGAMAAFFFGIVQYIWGIREGVPAEIDKGKKFMLWGLLALFVMFSVWGIVTYVQNIFGIQGQNSIIIPRIEFGGSSRNINTTNTALPTGTQNVNNTVRGTGSGGSCAGKSIGSSCTVSAGRAGTCGNNGAGEYGCYATPGGSGTPTGAQVSYDACIQQGSSISDCQGIYQQYINSNQTGSTGPAGGSGTAAGPNGTCTPPKVYDSDTGTCVNSIVPTGVGVGGDCTYSNCSSGLSCDYDDGLGYSICTQPGI